MKRRKLTKLEKREKRLYIMHEKYSFYLEELNKAYNEIKENNFEYKETFSNPKCLYYIEECKKIERNKIFKHYIRFYNKKDSHSGLVYSYFKMFKFIKKLERYNIKNFDKKSILENYQQDIKEYYRLEYVRLYTEREYPLIDFDMFSMNKRILEFEDQIKRRVKNRLEKRMLRRVITEIELKYNKKRL